MLMAASSARAGLEHPFPTADDLPAAIGLYELKQVASPGMLRLTRPDLNVLPSGNYGTDCFSAWQLRLHELSDLHKVGGRYWFTGTWSNLGLPRRLYRVELAARVRCPTAERRA